MSPKMETRPQICGNGVETFLAVPVTVSVPEGFPVRGTVGKWRFRASLEATNIDVVVFEEGNYKLVPWISWDDWTSVSESLFSSSPRFAFSRISAWRSRGCLPVVIQVTASILEIQQKDSYFRDGLSDTDLLPDDMLTMLYCMAIMRLVNGIVDKTRKKNEISIGEAADVIGIPRMLIDIRHECSHRDLPSVRLVRLASIKALDWLKAYYWEPQKMVIPCPSDRTAAKEIKSKIRDLALSLDVKQTTGSGSSLVKGKRMNHYEHLCGRSKFLSLMAVKFQSSKSSGSKKHITKALKNVLKLYSSFPSEVVSILLEFLLKAQESAAVSELRNSSQLDDWKPLIMKLSNKVPEMLLSLLKAVVQMIETREGSNQESAGGEHLKLEQKSGFHVTEHLSCLFEWLMRNLQDVKPSRRKITSTEIVGSPNETVLPNSALLNLLWKCLTVSSLGNNHLATAAVVLAQTAGNYSLVQKLNKLASIHTLNTDTFNEISPVDPERFYNQQENSIRQAANKLEFFKHKLSQRSKLKEAIGETKKKRRRWSMVKSWKPCPIGMLPSDHGSSGVIPVLEIVNVPQEKHENIQLCKEKLQVNQSCGKREADCPVGVLDDSIVKRHKETEYDVGEDDRFLEDVNSHLMISGVWKRVTENELINMASAVRVLV